MAGSDRPGILILPDVTFQKYHDEEKPLPFEATPQKVKQELEKRLPEVAIDLPPTWEAATARLPEARIILAEGFTREMLGGGTVMKICLAHLGQM
jgi:hypothetical protein